MSAPATLSYQVFVSDGIPFDGDEKAPNGDQHIFNPISSTLICGDTDAVLVDPPMTTAQAERLGQWIEDSGKHLTQIFVTHGHGDHWFGTAPLLQRFPDASAVATPGTIDVMRQNASPEVRAQVWDKSFPGQIPDSPVLADPAPGGTLDLEGNDLHIVEVGHSDTDNSTILYAPSIGLVVAGDVVYNGMHQYLVEAKDGGFDAWTTALDAVADLEPRHVVAGHKNKALDDDPSSIEDTRRYLEDSQQMRDGTESALGFFEGMLSIYPERLNRSALWFWGAQPLFE